MDSEMTLNEILSNFNDKSRDNLIPILQEEQRHRGFISREAIIQIGTALNLPVSKIYGVASFYNQFRFNAPGKHYIQICRGTACHVKGSARVLDSLLTDMSVKAGETTRDKMFSIEVVACVGACSLAPVIVVDNEFHANVTSAKMSSIVSKLRKEEK
ncbi:NAD(P)H-dependent oxidoreductase subunit E [Myxococcota bacterium]|nr:NAD(P)H-dependent oxidoreductase subunit E [Myxococcota bacterium]MBU1382363.1 NAD(P)H-dependent oxidoreductase subunit E [Myxococcota bacterium]MBU1498700.1 NAD(P)H-dependent oxidoreductase subunit E [Myxococcota bacterium]